MELALSLLVSLSVCGCTLSAPPALLVALSSTPATLTLQPPSEHYSSLATVDNYTPATINAPSSAAEKKPPRVTFVISDEHKSREKKSTSSATCTDGPHKSPFTLCNNAALAVGYQGGDSSLGHLSSRGSISGPSSLSHFGEPSHFNGGAGLNEFSHGETSGLRIEAGAGLPSHTISGAYAKPHASIYPQNLPSGLYSRVIGYDLPWQYQGLPISGAFAPPSQVTGLLPYQLGDGLPIAYYKTRDSREMQAAEEINKSQQDMQAEFTRQQAETKMRDAAALEEANMSLFRSGGGGGLSLPPVPVIDNFLPTIPLSNGQQLRGVFPRAPGGGGGGGGGTCGAIPLLMSCSPRLASGSFVGSPLGYGSGVYGGNGAYVGDGAGYYAGSYQFVPWFNGIYGGGYRQENAHPTTASPIPMNNAGVKKMEKPDQNSSKGGTEKKIESGTALPKDSTGGGGGW